MAVTAFEAFMIEAGFVVKIVSYVAVFGIGAWVGWQLKSAMSIVPFENVKDIYTGTSPIITGGVKYKPVRATGGAI